MIFYALVILVLEVLSERQFTTETQRHS